MAFSCNLCSPEWQLCYYPPPTPSLAYPATVSLDHCRVLSECSTQSNIAFIGCFQPSWIREHFVCVDQDRLLYHFLVEGTVVKDGSKVQCDVSFVALALKPWVGVSVQSHLVKWLSYTSWCWDEERHVYLRHQFGSIKMTNMAEEMAQQHITTYFCYS